MKQLKNLLFLKISFTRFVKVSMSVVFFAIQSCVKDKPEAVIQTPVQLTTSKKVYVVNEGNFGIGNGSISLYDPSNQQVITDFYFNQNGTSPGDVVQSLNKLNDNFYVVVNNSKKIIQCDDHLKKTDQILDFMSPRYIQQVSYQKAYVSDLYANSISVVDLNTHSKSGSIVCSGKTEKMVFVYNKVFVTNTDRPFIYVIDGQLDQIVDSIYVGINASSLVLDKQSQVWVLSSGDQSKTKGRLSRINSSSHAIESFWEFELQNSPWQLCISKGRDSLYFLNEHIYRMTINELQLPTQAFVNRGSKNFYGLGINPSDYKVYVSDALDYAQASTIYVYDQKGTQTHFFKAGINANGFYFE